MECTCMLAAQSYGKCCIDVRTHQCHVQCLRGHANYNDSHCVGHIHDTLAARPSNEAKPNELTCRRWRVPARWSPPADHLQPRSPVACFLPVACSLLVLGILRKTGPPHLHLQVRDIGIRSAGQLQKHVFLV